MVLQYILLSILLVCSVVIIAAVTIQKSNEGLSGSIAGGSETYYGKDKSNQTGKKLFKITLIASIIFAVVTLAVYVMQPDHPSSYEGALGTDWIEASTYDAIHGHDHE